MPYSFTQIERDKSASITYVFWFLILIYFGFFWVLAALCKSYALSSGRTAGFQTLNLGQTLVIFGAAFLLGYSHWTYATTRLVPRILGVLKAEKLDPKDSYHQRFRNIVDEVSVATGGTKMEAVVVPTMALNAFAVMDFSGSAVIGVTEGLLSKAAGPMAILPVPPVVAPFSTRMVFAPFPAAVIAAARPEGPLPTTATSASNRCMDIPLF